MLDLVLVYFFFKLVCVFVAIGFSKVGLNYIFIYVRLTTYSIYFECRTDINLILFERMLFLYTHATKKKGEKGMFSG